jgi:hypothetical protein
MAKSAVPLLLSLAVGSVQAATTIPFTFSAGTTARAADVNADFQALVSAMNTLSTALGSTEAAVTAITASSTTFAGNDTFSGNVSFSGNASIAGSLQSTSFDTQTLSAGSAALRIANSSSAPATAASTNTGELYFDTTSNELMFSDGSKWRNASNTDNYSFIQDGTHDTTSSGMLASRQLTFNKLSATSRIRISYSDALLLIASSGGPATAIWQVMVDGNPEPIQVSLYAGTSQTATDSATVVGYVSGLTQGMHTIQISVSSSGSPPAAVGAGWSNGSTFTLEAREVN